MATYRSISASEYSADAPVTATWADAVSNNPIAITEGASGAPRIQSAAFHAPAAGSTVVARMIVDEKTTSATSYGDALGILNVAAAGTIRVALDLKTDNASYTASADVRKNGVSASEETETSTSYVEHTVDIAVAVGDTISVHIKTSNGSGTTSIRDIEIRNDSADIAAL